MRSSEDIQRDIGGIPGQIKEAARRGDFAGVGKLTQRRQEMESELLRARGLEAETGIDRTGAEILRLFGKGHKIGEETARLEQAVTDAKAALDANTLKGSQLRNDLGRATEECRRHIKMAVCTAKAIEEYGEVVAAETMREDPDPGLKMRVAAVMAGSIHGDYTKSFGPSESQFNIEMRCFQENPRPAREIIRDILWAEAEKTGGVPVEIGAVA